MNDVGTIFSALGGTGVLACLIAAVASYLKARAAARHYHREACRAHEEHDDKLLALHLSLDAIAAGLAALQEENAMLRGDILAKERRIAKLERDLSNALVLGER